MDLDGARGDPSSCCQLCVTPVLLNIPHLLISDLTEADMPTYIVDRKHPEIAQWDRPTTGSKPDYSTIPQHNSWMNNLAIRSIDDGVILGNITFDSTDQVDGGFESDFSIDGSS